jgi:hypothetical protein
MPLKTIILPVALQYKQYAQFEFSQIVEYQGTGSRYGAAARTSIMASWYQIAKAS